MGTTGNSSESTYDGRADPRGAGRRVRVKVATRGTVVLLGGFLAALVLLCGDRPDLERNLGTPGRASDGHLPGNVTSLAFARGGRILASADSERVIRLWDVARGVQASDVAWEGVARVVASPDGRTLAITDGSPAVTILGAESGAVIRTLALGQGAAPAVRAAFSPDGHTLAVSYRDGSIRAWEARGPRSEPIADGGRPASLAMAYSPDGRTLACGDAGGMIRLRDASAGVERVAARAHAHGVLSVAFSPGGDSLASGGLSDPSPRLWDTATLRPARALRGRSLTVAHVAYSPDGRTIAAAGSGGMIGLWDATTGRPRWGRRAHDGWVLALAFSPDGRTLATGGGDGVVTLRSAMDPEGAGLH